MTSIFVSPSEGATREFHGPECEANILFGGVLLIVCSETEQHAWAPGSWHSYRVTKEQT